MTPTEEQLRAQLVKAEAEAAAEHSRALHAENCVGQLLERAEKAEARSEQILAMLSTELADDIRAALKEQDNG